MSVFVPLFEHKCYICMVPVWWYFTQMYGFCKYVSTRVNMEDRLYKSNYFLRHNKGGHKLSQLVWRHPYIQSNLSWVVTHGECQKWPLKRGSVKMDQSCHQMDCQALSQNIIDVFMDVNEHKLCWIMYMVYAFFSGIQCINVLNFQILFVK